MCHFDTLCFCPPGRCRLCCTMTAQCWRTTMQHLPGASTFPNLSSTSSSTWITWNSSVFVSSSSRLYWPQTSRSTLISWLNSIPRSEMNYFEQTAYKKYNFLQNIDLSIERLLSKKKNQLSNTWHNESTIQVVLRHPSL